MKRLVVVGFGALVLTSAWVLTGYAYEQCELAAAFGWLSPAQNTACMYEWMFALMGGWV